MFQRPIDCHGNRRNKKDGKEQTWTEGDQEQSSKQRQKPNQRLFAVWFNQRWETNPKHNQHHANTNEDPTDIGVLSAVQPKHHQTNDKQSQSAETD